MYCICICVYFSTRRWRFDEAVLKLDAPVTFDEDIKPVCLSDRDHSSFPTDLPAVVYGWGDVGEDGKHFLIG